MPQAHYDLIIIGGRCAGSSLALRLAETDLKILLVDRATFPGLPDVPSSPAMHPGTLQLMDELGIPESEYTLPDSHLTEYTLDFVGYFQSRMSFDNVQGLRQYAAGIDRAVLDTVLWKRAIAASNITAKEGFSVQKILRDAYGAPVAITGRTQDNNEQTFTANLVVGADGRFSFTARQMGAEVIEERNEHTSSGYFAEWENIAPMDDNGTNALHVYATDDAFALFIIPIGNGRVLVNAYMPTNRASRGGKSVQEAYMDNLAKVPEFTARLKHARQVSDVIGMRKVGNGYRQAYGSHFALVGDALHYKDPIDGQGIYDALSGSRMLAQAILHWKANRLTWAEAGEQYQQQFHDFSYPMFNHTVERIKQQLYTPMPALLIKTYMRWLMSDPVYKYQFMNYLSRSIPAEAFTLSAGLSPQVIGRGILRDLRKLFSKQQTRPARLTTQELPVING